MDAGLPVCSMPGMKFTPRELSKKWGVMHEKFLGDLLCHVATWSSHVATSILHPSATSRRESPRRDVSF